MNTDIVSNRNASEVQHRHEQTRGTRYFRPNVDILESEEELLVLADLPGVSHEGVSLDYENGVLTLCCRVTPRQPEDTSYMLREYSVGDFYRAFEINEPIESEKIHAECANGVLTIHLPKARAGKPRKIQVTRAQ